MRSVETDFPVGEPAVPVILGNPSLRIFQPLNVSAIATGVVMGLANYILLMLLGLALGVSAIDFDESGSSIHRFSAFSLVWALASMLLALFVGSFFAAKTCGLRRKSDGITHGLIMWGVTGLFILLISVGVSSNMIEEGALYYAIFVGEKNLWVFFLIMLLSALAGIFGGLTGIQRFKRHPRVITVSMGR